MTIQNIFSYRSIVATLCFINMQAVYADPEANCNDTLTATLTQGLDFGDYVGSNAGTITVAADGGRSATGGIVLFGGAVSAATYVFSNSNTSHQCKNKWIKITGIPTSISISGPASMTINNFVTSAAADGNRFRLKNTTTVTIGADLITNNSQAPGSYSGNFTVDFNY